MRVPRSGLLAVLVLGAALLTANPAKADDFFYYRGPHAVPSTYGGFCNISVRHFHSYKPDDPKVFRYDDRTYIFIGDPTAHGWNGARVPYYGHHPIPGGWGGGWCFIGGPHNHFYRPVASVPYRFHGGIYYYAGGYTDPWYIRNRAIYEPVFSTYYVNRPGYIRPVIYTPPPRFYAGPRVTVNVAPWRGPMVRVGAPGVRVGVGAPGVRVGVGGPGVRVGVGAPVGRPGMPVGGHPGVGVGVRPGMPVGGPPGVAPGRPGVAPGHPGVVPGRGPVVAPGHPGPVGRPGVAPAPGHVGGRGPGVAPAPGHVGGRGPGVAPAPGHVGGRGPGLAPAPGRGPAPVRGPGVAPGRGPGVAPGPGIKHGGPTPPPAINKGLRPTAPRPAPTAARPAPAAARPAPAARPVAPAARPVARPAPGKRP
ncbi:MAG TPA: hypothetical protein VGQ83_06250 [Polyangia bacterium]